MKIKILALVLIVAMFIVSPIESDAHDHNYRLYSKNLVTQYTRNCREKPYYCTVTVKGYECRYRCTCGKETSETITEETHSYNH